MRVASIQVKANDLKDYKQAWEKLEKMLLEAAQNHDLILVPECAFPSYFIHGEEGDLNQILNEGDSYLNRIKDISRQEKVYIAYGYVEKSGDTIYNSALLVDRNGEEVIKKRKSFLWHFDSKWFAEGDDLAVADTEFGKVAVVVCADARMPEIVRLAALEGAKFIIDLANLTASGPHMSELQNVQSAFMLSVRALENQAWLAVSDKWGVESNTITYTGRSGVYAPDGACLYQASADRDEIVSVEIPVDANGKITTSGEGYEVQRRPELYKTLVQETESLPITQILAEKVVPADITPYIAVASGKFNNDEEYIRTIQRLANQGSEIICMPPARISIENNANQISSLLPEKVCVIATVDKGNGVMDSYILSNEGIQEKYQTLHHDAASNEYDSIPVFQTHWGKIGVIHNQEALLPEWSRTMMLLGADCIVWPNNLPFEIASKVSRTRAAESRIFVVSAQTTDENDAVSQVIDPNGAVVASTLIGERLHACGAFTPFTLSRMKELVPGTNVVKNRRPQYYSELANSKTPTVNI
ncbi:nitrilase-related carbon-nitrogen hydrolase [Bacillus sp. ISL-37]|uniref:nitrilase-related carbon-nitrogen hydrolase n=1 Tax=Bacillus sp. ISL-37 TaxID=2819123 RepID=UPI001BE5098D|nr:nitrilase-related carbon-nitrogen hydrolase [Bacillus sp. ISL-37]MBT2686027.1 hypothetical protein [Bacillus sp. ISL-37]